jgi:homoserine dehydrogenase
MLQDGIVPLIIMTHETSEGDAHRACEEIDNLPPVRGETVRMWVRD